MRRNGKEKDKAEPSWENAINGAPVARPGALPKNDRLHRVVLHYMLRDTSTFVGNFRKTVIRNVQGSGAASGLVL